MIVLLKILIDYGTVFSCIYSLKSLKALWSLVSSLTISLDENYELSGLFN